MKKYVMMAAMLAPLLPHTGLCQGFDEMLSELIGKLTQSPQREDIAKELLIKLYEELEKYPFDSEIDKKNIEEAKKQLKMLDALDKVIAEGYDESALERLAKNPELFCKVVRGSEGRRCGLNKKLDYLILTTCMGHVLDNKNFFHSHCRRKIVSNDLSQRGKYA